MAMHTGTLTRPICGLLALAGLAAAASADITNPSSVVDLSIEGFSLAGTGDVVNLINDGRTTKGSGPDNTFPSVIGTTSAGKDVVAEWYEQSRTDGGEGSLVVIQMMTEDLSPLVPQGTTAAGVAASHFQIRVGSETDGGLRFANWVDRVRLTGFTMSASNGSQTLFRRASDDPSDIAAGRAQATIDTIEEWDGIIQGAQWSATFGDPFFTGMIGDLGDWHTMTLVLEVQGIPAPASVAGLGIMGLAAARRRR